MPAAGSIACAPPPGIRELPDYDRGWIVDGDRHPYLRFGDSAGANWSDELELLHEEASRRHFLDMWTREEVLGGIAGAPDDGTVLDLGCSTGYLLEDLAVAYPRATLIGVDLVAAGLAKAHEAVPDARLLQADACALPLADQSVDAVASANLLEHVPDDGAALAEIHRIMRPGAKAAIVVPAGPSTYDYYDRFLGHERRYARGELAGKARAAGLEVLEDRYIGSLLYPAFYAVKQSNRLRLSRLEGVALELRVARDIARTRDSRIGRALWLVETRLGLRLPFGVRCLVIVRRPATAGIR